MNWIDDLLEATKEAEAPESFLKWAGLCAVAAVMKKNVYLPRGSIYNLYPNIFCLIITESGGRKGYPAWLIKTLVSKTQSTRVISGRNSIQAILNELSKTRTVVGGKMYKNAQCLLQSGELTNLIIDDPSALNILTELYDTHWYEEEWKNTLKTQGTPEVLREPCITVFGATNETHLTEVVREKDVRGGFIARTLLVREEGTEKIDSLVYSKQNRDEVIIKLVPHLRRISRIRGVFQYADDAASFFDAWYKPFIKRAREEKDKTGIKNRYADHVLKIAMLLSLTEKDELILTLDNIKESMKLCERFLDASEFITEGTGKSALGSRTKLVFEEIGSQPGWKVSRKKLLQKYYGEFSARELGEILDTLMEGDMIERIMDDEIIYYTWTKPYIDKFKALVAEQEKANGAA